MMMVPLVAVLVAAGVIGRPGTVLADSFTLSPAGSLSPHAAGPRSEPPVAVIVTSEERAPSARVRAVAAVARQAGGGPAQDVQITPEETHEGDFIMHHIMDGDYIDYPAFNKDWMSRWHLPHWKPIHIGGFTIDLSPTRHVVVMLISTALCALVLISAARSHKRRAREGKPPRGLANAIEATVLYLRSEVVLPNVGPHGEKFVPYLITCFFFILFANLFGLIPYSATATSNIAVTATLATIAFLVVEISGMRTLGAGYIKTIVFWPHDMSLAVKLPLTFILTPVELIGKFTKPFALAIRLFANMIAGHIVILALIGMIFTFGSIWIAPLPLAMTIGIMLLEILIAFIQAFVFTLLVSVFIGQVREGAH